MSLDESVQTILLIAGFVGQYFYQKHALADLKERLSRLETLHMRD